MPDKAKTDCLDDDEERRRALWGPAIALLHTGDPTECLDLHDRGIKRPDGLTDFFMDGLRNKRLYKKLGRKEKPETFDYAYRVAGAVHEGRRIRDTEGIPLRAAFEWVSKDTGIDIEKLWNLQNGNGTKKEKVALSQTKDSYRT